MNAKDLAMDIQELGLGRVTEDIFYSLMPDSPDDCIVTYDTGGYPADENLSRRDPTFAVHVRGTDYDVAYTKAKEILTHYHQRMMYSIGADVVQMSVAMQSEPMSLGWDQSGRIKFIINFVFTIQ